MLSGSNGMVALSERRITLCGSINGLFGELCWGVCCLYIYNSDDADKHTLPSVPAAKKYPDAFLNKTVSICGFIDGVWLLQEPETKVIVGDALLFTLKYQ